MGERLKCHLNNKRQLAEQRASNELIKLIRKLRWMGMKEEAEKVVNQLTLRDVPAEDSVVAASGETD